MSLIAPERLRFALPFALVHWGLLVLIQCENVVGYLLPETYRATVAARFFLTLPFLQTENLLLSAAVVVAGCLMAGQLLNRLLFLVLWVGLSLYLVFDQVYYKVFFDHFRSSIIEGLGQVNAAQLASSLRYELDLAFGLNVALVALSTALLAWRRAFCTRQPSPQVHVRRKSWGLPTGAAVLLVAGIPSVSSPAYLNLQHHPLLVLADESMRRSLVAELEHQSKRWAADAGPVEWRPAEQDQRLAEAVQACHGGSRPPNLLLIVLESVGSLQLLGNDGLPSEEATPRLARFARGGVVFDSVYSIFPGTVRTHVAMTTGGRFPTWGSTYELLGFPYQGPTLPRRFSDCGYSTALFAGERLDGENMAAYIRQAGYQTLYDFGDDRAHHNPDVVVSSWGAREEYTIGKIKQWLDTRAQATSRPFFLNYLTAATHHPYGVPPDYACPFPGRDSFSRYRNSLHYTDAAIGKLLDALEARGLLANTIIAITGDHGQAFGTLHPMNFTHRNFLYEENVKSFLIVVPPARLARPVVSHRIGSTGDILPTLLGAAGLPAADVPGRSLLAESLVPQPVFFHKNAIPEQWGLRHGPWKYIARIRDHSAELYDLSRDPEEKVNLASRDPDRVRRYDALCQRLFVRHDEEFTARLQGFHHVGGRGLSLADFSTAGPKKVVTGVVVNAATQEFVERSTFEPSTRPSAHTRWISYGHAKSIDFSWQSPSGGELHRTIPIQAEWAITVAPYPGKLPMEEGKWTLLLRDPIDGKTLLSTHFYVTALAAPIGRTVTVPSLEPRR